MAGEDRRRAHTCHVVGSQMIVLGGYPPGQAVDPRVECDSNFIKVFDLSNESVSTKCHFLNKSGTKGNCK